LNTKEDILKTVDHSHWFPQCFFSPYYTSEWLP